MQFSPEIQAKLEAMAAEEGCRSEELIEEAVIGYFDESKYAREMLDKRYDDMESGKVQMMDGDEAFRLLMEKTEANANRRSG